MPVPTVDRSHHSPNHSSRAGHAVKVLILHATAGSLGSSLSQLCNPAPVNPKTGTPDPELAVSSHYVIAKTGAIYQLVEETQAAWHAGVAVWQGETRINEISIGVELENANNGRDPYPPAQVQALLDLTRDIQTRHPAIAFARHLDVARPVGRKTDPAGFQWSAYLAAVTAAPTPPPPLTKRYRVKHRYITQRKEDNGPPIVRELVPGEELVVDMWYANNRVHFADGSGFGDLADLEPVEPG